MTINHMKTSTKRIFLSSAKGFESWLTFPRRIIIWTFTWPMCVVSLYECLMWTKYLMIEWIQCCVYVISVCACVLPSHTSRSTPSPESECLCCILRRWGQFMERTKKSFRSFYLCIWVGKYGCIMYIVDAPHAHNMLVLVCWIRQGLCSWW